MMNNKDIPALTGLRFVAALAIVLDHTWPVIFKFDSMAVINNAMHQLAYVGMTLFFVLSGFIIHHNYADVVRQPGGLWRFAVARFSRLYPLYLLVLTIDFVTVRPSLDWMSLRMLTMTQSWTYQFSAGRFLPYGYHYSVVAWSISTEVFFYAVYPAVAAVLHRTPKGLSPVMCAIPMTVALWWINGHPPAFDANGWFSYASPYARVLEFATGCVLANAYREGYLLRAKEFLALIAVSWISLFTLRGFIGNEAISVGMLCVGLVLPVAVLIFALASSDVFPWLRAPFAVHMGDASYSMYLLHLIIAEKLAFSAQLAGTHDDWVNALTRFIVAMMLIGLLSVISYRYFERPAQMLLRGLLAARPKVSAPGDSEYSR